MKPEPSADPNLGFLVESARRALIDEEPLLSDLPAGAGTAQRITRILSTLASQPGGRSTERARALEKLRYLAAVGLLVVGTDVPMALGPRRHAWPVTARPCGFCGAAAGKRCTTRDGEPASPHLPRRRAVRP